jgi:hypothetical protein
MMLHRFIPLALLLCVAAPLAQESASPEPTAPAAATGESQMGAAGLYALFYTAEGTFACRLFEDDAPLNVRNFVDLACGTTMGRSSTTWHATR